MKYEATVTLPLGTIDRFNKLFDIEDMEEMSEDELYLHGAKQNDYESIFEVRFENGSRLTYDLASGDTNYYDNVIWYECDDDAVGRTLDCLFYLEKEFEVDIDDDVYIVHIVEK